MEPRFKRTRTMDGCLHVENCFEKWLTWKIIENCQF